MTPVVHAIGVFFLLSLNTPSASFWSLLSHAGAFWRQQENRFPLKVPPNFHVDAAPWRVKRGLIPKGIVQRQKGNRL
jgi:hypothetical protein